MPLFNVSPPGTTVLLLFQSFFPSVYKRGSPVIGSLYTAQPSQVSIFPVIGKGFPAVNFKPPNLPKYHVAFSI